MTCPRCHGCMVWSEESISRYHHGSLVMRRCLNCGNLEDTQIMRQRRFMAPVGEDRHAKIWNRIRHLVMEAV